MYNTSLYAFKVWLTSWLAIPNIYLLYYLINSGVGEYFPIRGYIVLVLTCLGLSIPVGLLFKLLLDYICKTEWTDKVKKWAAFAALQLLLLLLFAALLFFNIITGQIGLNFWVMSSCTTAVCVWIYPLKATWL